MIVAFLCSFKYILLFENASFRMFVFCYVFPLHYELVCFKNVKCIAGWVFTMDNYVTSCIYLMHVCMIDQAI